MWIWGLVGGFEVNMSDEVGNKKAKGLKRLCYPLVAIIIVASVLGSMFSGEPGDA